MLRSIRITLNGLYELHLPIEGVGVVLNSDEWNPFTNKADDMRPLATAQVTSVPLSANRGFFDRLQGQSKYAVLTYNEVPIIEGPITEYSPNEQQDSLSITIISAFKQVISEIGDAARGLAVCPFMLGAVEALTREGTASPNIIAAADASTHVVRAVYNPMDTATGRIVASTDNADEYCKPAVRLADLFASTFSSLGWSIDVSSWTDTMRAVCLVPTENYLCSGYCVDLKGTYPVAVGGSQALDLTGAASRVWEVDPLPVETLSGGRLQYRTPARNLAFHVFARYKCTGRVRLRLLQTKLDGDGNPVPVELLNVELVGTGTVNNVTDWQNTQEGFGPLTLELQHVYGNPAAVEFETLRFYDVYSIYETNSDPQLIPAGRVLPLLDNSPSLSILSIYREFLVMFQYAQHANPVTKSVTYYPISQAAEQRYKALDLSPMMLWEGYVPVSERSLGLAQQNTVRYKGDTKGAANFYLSQDSLNASGVYWESTFAAPANDTGWDALVVPSLNYQTKTVNGVPFEYLAYNAIQPLLAVVRNADAGGPFVGRLVLDGEPLHMCRLVGEYWATLLSWLSPDGGEPEVFELRLHVPYYVWKTKLQQSMPVWHNGYAVIATSSYDIINQEFTGRFLRII